jgi:hypothetical protein
VAKNHKNEFLKIAASSRTYTFSSFVGGVRRHFYENAVIRQLNRLSKKRRSFKRGLWGSCVATLCRIRAILLSGHKKAPGLRGGFVQFANKVLIALP